MESRSPQLPFSKFHSYILIFTLCLVSICESTGNSLCTTGFTENKLSFGKMYCCSYLCENKDSPRYNLKRCCASNCRSSYLNTCDKIDPELGEHPVFVEPSVSTKPTFTAISMTQRAMQVQSVSTPRINVLISLKRTRIAHAQPTQKRNVDKNTLPPYLPYIQSNKMSSPIFTKITSRTIYPKVSKILPTKANVNSTNKISPNTSVELNNDKIITAYIAVIVTVIGVLAVVIFVICILLRRKRQKSYQNENKKLHFNSKQDVLVLSVKEDKVEEHEPNLKQKCAEIVPCLPSEPPRPCKISIDINVENYFKKEDCLGNDRVDGTSNINLPEELNPDNVIVHGRIGKGFFGQVLKGTLHCNGLLDDGILVALKTPNSSTQFSSDVDVYCLQLELKILSFIGKHSNIVSLIGAITKPNHIGNFVIVSEFCEFGDLRNYIERRKSNHEIDDLDLATPVANDLVAILERSAIRLSALLLYALQIANGAYYLTQIKTVIHRDLALRNMLLTKNHIVKLGDFGLAVNDSAYEVKTRKILPTRWLPPESLNPLNAVFTAKSDVWSFGVLLWELFSLADNPMKIEYAPRDREQFRQWLIADNRYERPKYAPDSIYQLMTESFHFEPKCRPEFLKCRTDIQDILMTYSSDVYEYILERIGF